MGVWAPGLQAWRRDLRYMQQRNAQPPCTCGRTCGALHGLARMGCRPGLERVHSPPTCQSHTAQQRWQCVLRCCRPPPPSCVCGSDDSDSMAGLLRRCSGALAQRCPARQRLDSCAPKRAVAAWSAQEDGGKECSANVEVGTLRKGFGTPRRSSRPPPKPQQAAQGVCGGGAMARGAFGMPVRQPMFGLQPLGP